MKNLERKKVKRKPTKYQKLLNLVLISTSKLEKEEKNLKKKRKIKRR